MSRAELREMWRAAMSAAGGTQRDEARERESPRAALFRPTIEDPGHLLFFPVDEGYELLDARGPCPAVGDELGWHGLVYRVLKVGASPFPGDRRPATVRLSRGAGRAGRARGGRERRPARVAVRAGAP